MTPEPTPEVNNTLTIARNSVWYGIEIFFSLFGAFLSSVLVARTIGPQRLGYFQYVVWLTNITTAVGAFGLPMTTRKYMAECLNRNAAPIARAIYQTSLRIQILLSLGITAAGLAVVLLAGDAAQRLSSILLVVNMAPRMIGLIPSQANSAAERMKRNTPPALIGGSLNVALTLVSLWVGWDLPGVAFSFLLGSTVETGLKLYDVRRQLAPVAAGKVPPELKRRMFSYSGQGLVLMLLNVVVWDRSDLVILKAMNPDIKQVAFFSVAFNLCERALMIPSAFGYSLGITMMAQFGRGEERLVELTISGAKYALLVALPLLFGIASISGPIIRLYGHQYLPVVPVLTVSALLAIPKALNNPAYLLLQTTENQGYLIWVGCIGGIVDIGLDFLLTPSHGALGAAWANGLAQTLAAAAVWFQAYRILRFKLRLDEFGRILLAGLCMIAAVLAVQHVTAGYWRLILSVLVGAAVWIPALRFSRALNATDNLRLRHAGKALPKRFRLPFERLIDFMAPA